MKIIMLQEKLKKNFEYKIYDEETNKQIYVAKANRIIGFGYRRIELLSYDNVFLAKQEDLMSIFISRIFPFLGGVNPKYYYYENSVHQGFFCRSKRTFKVKEDIVGKINDKIYRIYIHTGNEYSIYENEYQVAAIKRSPWKRRNADKYFIEFQRTVPIHLISIITVILDLETYPDDMNMSKLSYNTNWEIKGKKKDRKWKASH